MRQRCLYWSITLHADDDGIIPLYLFSNNVYFQEDGIDADDLMQDLSDLEVNDFIKVYKDNVDDEDYIQVLYWWDKQFIDNKLYRPTEFPTSKYYLYRPNDLTKKRSQPSFYDSSRTPLDQNRIGEISSDKPSGDEISPDDEDLPFDEHGNPTP